MDEHDLGLTKGSARMRCPLLPNPVVIVLWSLLVVSHKRDQMLGTNGGRLVDFVHRLNCGGDGNPQMQRRPRLHSGAPTA